jgi:hypothetical protein
MIKWKPSFVLQILNRERVFDSSKQTPPTSFLNLLIDLYELGKFLILKILTVQIITTSEGMFKTVRVFEGIRTEFLNVFF